MATVRTIPITRYGTTTAISDELAADVYALATAKEFALAGWERAVRRAGFQPLAAPEVHLDHSDFPQVAVDPETGAEYTLPANQMRAVGNVVPADVPLPAGGINVDPHSVVITYRPST